MARVVFEQFDSLDVFARSLSRPVNSVFGDRGDLSSESTERPSWFGTASFEEAMNLFNNGWTEKADEIRKEFVKFERAIQQDVTYEKKRPATAVVGFAPHVPNAIIGLPNSMIHTERTPMKAKVVRIVYNMAMNANTSSDDIMKAGLAALKIAYSMERKGYRVRIDVSPKFSKYERSETACAIVCIKDWRQPIDIKKIAFPVAHPSMFRRLGFKWMETTPDLKESGFRYGYGQSLEDVDKEKEFLKERGVLGDNDYYLNVKLARDNGFDLMRVAKAIGIKNL